MHKIPPIVTVVLALSGLLYAIAEPSADSKVSDPVAYDERLRPQFHYTKPTGGVWDACGMVHYDGEWHMFPGWNHAVSTDLIHWKHLSRPVAPWPNVKYPKCPPHIPYSGSAVVDELNALGKQTGDVKTLYAIYTAHTVNPAGKYEYFQAASYSTDKGRTWTQVNGGKPVIDHIEGFDPEQRDPGIFYHPGTKSYIVILQIDGKDHAVRLFRSFDLLNWQKICDIPNKSMECMNMFPVPLDGDPKNLKWVISDALSDYEVGDFDGTQWVGLYKGKRRRFDMGDCYYAAQVFTQAPGNRAVQVGLLQALTRHGPWSKHTPFMEAGMPFDHQMSIPIEITLRTTPEGIRLYGNPVKEIAMLYRKTDKFEGLTVDEANTKLAGLNPELIDMSMAFPPSKDLTLNVRGMKIEYDAKKKEFAFTNKDRVEGIKAFLLRLPEQERRPYTDTGRRAVPAPMVDGKVKLRVLVDRASLEYFVNDGQAAASFTVLPDPKNRSISISGEDSQVITTLEVNELASIWKP